MSQYRACDHTIRSCILSVCALNLSKASICKILHCMETSDSLKVHLWPDDGGVIYTARISIHYMSKIDNSVASFNCQLYLWKHTFNCIFNDYTIVYGCPVLDSSIWKVIYLAHGLPYMCVYCSCLSACLSFINAIDITVFYHCCGYQSTGVDLNSRHPSR